LDPNLENIAGSLLKETKRTLQQLALQLISISCFNIWLVFLLYKYLLSFILTYAAPICGTEKPYYRSTEDKQSFLNNFVKILPTYINSIDDCHKHIARG
jgi:hypothetical protein